VGSSAGWCTAESQFGASQPGTAVCASGGGFRQNRSGRREGAVRLCLGNGARDKQCFSAGAATISRTRESTPAFNASAGDGTESSGTGERCFSAKIESHSDQPDQKTDRAT